MGSSFGGIDKTGYRKNVRGDRHGGNVTAVPAGTAEASGAAGRSGVDAGGAPSSDDWANSRHVLATRGRELHYLVRTGCLSVDEGKNGKQCEIFSVGYFLEDNGRTGRRPLTFCFNGGPGASSIWVNLGALGPRRIDYGDRITQPAPWRRITDNEFTWLNFTDLVFVDAPGTGYSRALGDKDPKDYWGVDADARVMADFVRSYCHRHGLWEAPKFLMGESYGGLRAPAMCKVLQRDMGVELAGLVLVSPVVDYTTIYHSPGNHLAYVLSLPTMAAVAHYHGKLDDGQYPDIDQAVEVAQNLAVEELLPALVLGGGLPGERKKKLASVLSGLTGLPADLLEDCGLAVSTGRFCKELLKGDGRTVGRFDGRLTGFDTDRGSGSPSYDPSDFLTVGPFVNSFNALLHSEFGYRPDRPYVFQSSEPLKHWKWESEHRGSQGFVNLVPSLRRDICENEYLVVRFACGLYDLATPFYASRYVVNALDLPAGAAERVSIRKYPGGHMMYTDRSNHERLFSDMASFYESAPLVRLARSED